MRIVIRKPNLAEKVANITSACMALKDHVFRFGWEFFAYDGELFFTASYKPGELYEFPIQNARVDEDYKTIIRELGVMKWASMEWTKEEHE